MYSFLKLETGSNAVRFLTAPWQYLCHEGFVRKDAPDHGQLIKCPAIMGVDCSICKSEPGTRPKPHWLVGVYSYKHNEECLIDLGYKSFSQIRELVRHPKWGDPLKYDIDFIVRDFDSIIVLPYPPEAFMGIVKEFDQEVLKNLTMPVLEDLSILNQGDLRKIKVSSTNDNS